MPDHTRTDTAPDRPRERTATDMVDPRAPRFGQILTATLLTLGVALQQPILVLAVAGILGTAAATRWRLDLYRILWRRGIFPLIGPPPRTESAVPHRFAKLLGATFTTIATILLYAGTTAGFPTAVYAGYLVASLVALLAAIGGLGDYCIGCKLYEEVALFRRLGVV